MAEAALCLGVSLYTGNKGHTENTQNFTSIRRPAHSE